MAAKVAPTENVELKDFNKQTLDITPSGVSFLKKTLNLTPNILSSIFIGSSSLILIIGLVSGLVIRPDNCIEQATIFSTIATNLSTLSVDATTTKQLLTTTSSSTSSSSSTKTSQPISTVVTIPDPVTIKSTISTNQASVATTVNELTTTQSITKSTKTDPRTIPSVKTTVLTSNTTTLPILTSDFRLSRIFLPKNYNLNLKTFFDPYKTTEVEYYEGVVKITFTLTDTSNFILFHMDESLEITDLIKIYNLDSEKLIESIQHDEFNHKEYQLYQLKLKTTLKRGDYRLEISYKGDFDLLNGFYKTYYREDNKNKTIIASQFEPTMARKAFPCFDEPSFKSSFDITIEHPDKTIALSNWPIKSSTILSNNRIQTVFETSAPMSTYLAAWVVAPDDFKYIEGKTSKSVPIRVYARKNAILKGYGDFALEVALKVVEFFENDYFKISQALPPKIDLVALPEFLSKGIEHWGMISFSEPFILFSPSENSILVKQELALGIAHELAHFWFGNYVSIGYWDDLWLKEATATLLSYKAIENVYPEMDITDQFIVDKMIPVMFDDGFDYSLNVATLITRPEQINSLYNSITYDKGASVLFMLEITVGKEKFKDGLIKFLTDNAFGVGISSKLYNDFDMPAELVAGGVNGYAFMEDFLNQINYPLVKVSLDYDETTNNSKVTFTQERFLLSVLDIDFSNIESRFNYTWQLYLQCKAGGVYNTNDTDDVTQHTEGSVDDLNFYLGSHQKSFSLNKPFSWIKCNKDFRSFYITQYSEYNLKAIEYVLQYGVKDTLSIGDRAHLLHSAYLLAYTNRSNYGIANLFSSYMESRETDYVPWKTYMWHLEKLAIMLEHKYLFNNIRNFALRTIKQLENQNGFSDFWDDAGIFTTKLLKISALDLLCRLQDEICLNKATQLFGQIPKDFFFSNQTNNPVSVNYRELVYKYHIQNTNNYEDWFLLNIHYYETIDPHENYNTLKALTHHRSSWLLNGLLSELMKSNGRIKSDQFYEVVSLIGQNPSGRHEAWRFVRRYYDKIVQTYDDSFDFSIAVKNIAQSFTEFYLNDELKEFFKNSANGNGYWVRKQTEEMVLNNIYWIKIRASDVLNSFVTDIV